MNKRWFLIGVMLLAVLMVVGCGIPQEDYDAVVAERDAGQTKLQSVQDELDTAKSELQSVKSQLTSLQSTVQTQKANMVEAGNYIEALHYFLYPVRISNNIPQLLSYKSDKEWLAATENAVKDTGDSRFETIFTQWNTGQVEGNLGFARFLSHMCIMSLRSLQ